MLLFLAKEDNIEGGRTMQSVLYSFLLDKEKSESQLPKKIVLFGNESPLKMLKNTFYSILKALFVFKIFKLLSSLFGHVEKTA